MYRFADGGFDDRYKWWYNSPVSEIVPGDFMEGNMTKTRVEIEFKEGRWGTGYYASMAYDGCKSSGSVELGPYPTQARAEKAVDLLAVMVAA